MIDEAAYQQQIDVALEQTGAIFVPVRLDHLRYFNGDGDSAVLLAYLLNILRLKHNNKNDRELLMQHDMAFKCMFKRIQSETGMGERRLTNTIKALGDKKLLKTFHGQGNGLWVCLDLGEIDKITKGDASSRNDQTSDLETTKDRFQKRSNVGSRNDERSFPYTKKPSSKSPSKSLGDAPRTTADGFLDRQGNNSRLPAPRKNPSPPAFCVTWAKQLRQILRLRQPPIAVGSGAYQSWAADFCQLWRSLGGDDPARDRISDYLEWYADNVSHPSLPVIKNAKQFREHFCDWLEPKRAKIERDAAEEQARRESGGDLTHRVRVVDGTPIIQKKVEYKNSGGKFCWHACDLSDPNDTYNIPDAVEKQFKKLGGVFPAHDNGWYEDD